eukprot:5776908-Pyramimonas_sp.AAC.1
MRVVFAVVSTVYWPTFVDTNRVGHAPGSRRGLARGPAAGRSRRRIEPPPSPARAGQSCCPRAPAGGGCPRAAARCAGTCSPTRAPSRARQTPARTPPRTSCAEVYSHDGPIRRRKR